MENTVKIIIKSTSQHNQSLNLLTTVKELYNQNHQLYQKPKSELPLDLTTIKTSEEIQTMLSSPLKKRYRADAENFNFTEVNKVNLTSPLKKRYVNELKINSPHETTPTKKKIQNTKAITASKQQNNQKSEKKFNDKKIKAIRKLKFDEFRSSPVSGTQIRLLHEIDENSMQESGDIDPQYNIVEITDEAKAELAQIKNVIGAYVCKLCTIEFEDAFGLARHRCSCIVLLEYRCPECGKKFNCPANLASHRRWHKPRDQMSKKSESSDSESSYPCKICNKTFKRHAYLTKHLAMHNKKPTSNKKSSPKSFELSPRSNHSHEDVLIPQTVFTFNQNTNSPKHESVEENSNSSSHSIYAESGGNFKLISSHFTEDENIAISALTNLRNGPSVIRHTLAV
ncbi:hypothetical protein PVAND_016310 [Polypedilum vanderplanki]|uniref:C2H2-type domain-containing protein n=1 Tax=Polypedilum vanderplanki TaxID=319348 RepID=A0A9J6BEQ5_POLVA|nr:hypothetical protein PVAND_016310 [Polypedilum vanderplanki]